MNTPQSGDTLSEVAHTGITADPPRILIAEDEQIVAADMRERLMGLGYSVSAVIGSGEDAVALATETSPDLLIVDIVLQGTIDGIEAVKQIQTVS